MRGKRARLLRAMAVTVCKYMVKDQDGKPISLGAGYNEYNQANNRTGWSTAKDGAGNIMYDPDGMALKQVVNNLPGTITCAWKLRVIYQNLKREYKYKHAGIDRSGSVEANGAGESKDGEG